jgi:chromatin remodeling complex protein RSC6
MNSKTSKATTQKKVAVKAAPVEVKPVEVKPVEVKPVEVKSVEVKSVEVNNTPVETSTPVQGTVTPVVENVPSEVDSIKQRLDVLVKSKQDQINELKKEIVELKKLQKDYEIELKNASKKSKKKKSSENGTPRKPSGFASPVVVSDKLYDFLSQYGVEKGAPIARTDVTRHITTYINERKLQNPEYRREIIPDASLKAIFGEPFEHKVKGDTTSPLVYTYLQLQKYLSQHFPKATPKASVKPVNTVTPETPVAVKV